MKRTISYLLSFCLTFSLLLPFIPAVKADNSEKVLNKPSLGLDTTSGKNIGPGISTVQAGSLAAEAGMLEGDIIVAIGGVKVRNSNDVASAWKSYSAGNKIEFELTRRGRKYSVDIIKNDSQKLGISINNTSGGALVESVVPGGPAEKAGIEKGDLIVGLNDETVTGPGSINKILEDCYNKEIVEIEFFHDDALNVADIELEASGFGISDITVLESEVRVGESIPLFCINATGDLKIKRAFSWFHDVPDEYGFIFGINDSDEEKGIRIENTYDEETGVYTSTLWADNITMKAAGDYYCYVQDNNNGSMESGRVNLKVYE